MNKSDWETILVQVAIKLFIKWLDEGGLDINSPIEMALEKAEANPAGLAKVVKTLFDDSEKIADIIAERLWERIGKE